MFLYKKKILNPSPVYLLHNAPWVIVTRIERQCHVLQTVKLWFERLEMFVWIVLRFFLVNRHLSVLSPQRKPDAKKDQRLIRGSIYWTPLKNKAFSSDEMRVQTQVRPHVFPCFQCFPVALPSHRWTGLLSRCLRLGLYNTTEHSDKTGHISALHSSSLPMYSLLVGLSTAERSSAIIVKI